MSKNKKRIWLIVVIAFAALFAVFSAAITVKSVLKFVKNGNLVRQDLSSDIDDFIRGSEFVEYDAIAAALSEAGVSYLFPDSTVKTKSVGNNGYVATIQGLDEGNQVTPYKTYLKLHITAKPDEIGDINFDEFTQTDDFNEWFSITEVKKTDKIYTKLLKQYEASRNILDGESSYSFDAENGLSMENSFYASIKEYYQIEDTEEELKELYSDSSGLTNDLRTFFSSDAADVAKIPKDTINKFQEKLTSLDAAAQARVNSAQYFNVGRISKTQYAILYQESASAEKPIVILIFQDEDENDNELTGLKFVDLRLVP